MTDGRGAAVDDRATIALREQRTRLSALLDRLDQAVITVGPGLEVSFANAAAEKLLHGRELRGEPLPDPWPDPSLRALAEAVFRPAAEPLEARVELSGGAVVLDVLALPPDASGEALLVVADLTEPRRRDLAEREFVTNAAHQLRTPVAAIASSIEVLESGAKEVPAERDRFLAHIDRQCHRLVRLTRALLVLARAQALFEPPELELVHLCPLLEQIAATLRPDEAVSVRVDCGSDVAALTNRDLLEQTITNLAENAAKFTSAGEIVLAAEGQAGGTVRILLSDTGPGSEAPEETLRARFYRDAAEPAEGFGLGLAIASESVRVLGGTLTIDSRAEGTTAAVELPSARLKT